MPRALIHFTSVILFVSAFAYGKAEDATWTDPSSGLTWLRCPLADEFILYPPKNPEFEEPQASCRQISSYDSNVRYLEDATWFHRFAEADNLVAEGYSDWRMPDIHDVLTLVNKSTCNDELDCKTTDGSKNILARNEFWIMHGESKLMCGNISDPKGDELCFATFRISETENKATLRFRKYLEDRYNWPPSLVVVRGGSPKEYDFYKGASDKYLKAAQSEIAEVDRTHTPTWTDTRTGLTWMRCPIGTTHRVDLKSYSKGRNPHVCDIDPLHTEAHKFTWLDAMSVAENLVASNNLDGWRVPTAKEMRTIEGCASGPDCSSQASEFPLSASGIGYWSSTHVIRQSKYCDDSVDQSVKIYCVYYSNLRSGNLIEHSQGSRFVTLVKGGEKTDSFSESANIRDQLLSERKAREDAKKKQETETYLRQREMQQKENEASQKAYESLVKADANYKARIPVFRKNLKPGDKAKQGLIIEVRGDLILVQTYACDKSIVLPSGKVDCIQISKRRGDAQWFNRSQLLP